MDMAKHSCRDFCKEEYKLKDKQSHILKITLPSKASVKMTTEEHEEGNVYEYADKSMATQCKETNMQLSISE